jgi:molybdate transport system regulatory protein
MSVSLTRTQVCQALGVSPKSLYLWEKKGEIPSPSRNRRGWRVYTPDQVDAIRSFLGKSETDAPENLIASREPSALSGLSARNQLQGEIVSINGDGVLCEVILRLGDGQEIVSVVTRNSVDRLGLKAGETATAVIKSTEVMLFR